MKLSLRPYSADSTHPVPDLAAKRTALATLFYPHDKETGDPRRMVYADPAVYDAVMSVTERALVNEQRLHAECMNKLYPGAFAQPSDAGQEVLAVDQLAYDHMFQSAGKRLERDLVGMGFPLPGQTWRYKAVAKSERALERIGRKVLEGPGRAGMRRLGAQAFEKMGAAIRSVPKKSLRFEEDQHMRDRQNYFHTLRRADKYDIGAQQLGKKDIARRLQLEQDLVYYKRLHDTVHRHLREGVGKLTSLLHYDEAAREVRLNVRDVGQLDAFFKSSFGVKAGRAASEAAERALHEAGDNAQQRDAVLERHLRSLLARVPFGIGNEGKRVADDGMLGLARAYVLEIGQHD